MRLARRIAVLALALLFVAGAASAQTEFYAILTGDQEVPPSGSQAGGSGGFVYDADTQMLTYVVAWEGAFTETAAHIHGPAARGASADPIFTLSPGNPKFGEVGPLDAQQLADLLAGLWYVNVHSATHPGGEIRGQIDIFTAVKTDSWSAVKSLYSR